MLYRCSPQVLCFSNRRVPAVWCFAALLCLVFVPCSRSQDAGLLDPSFVTNNVSGGRTFTPQSDGSMMVSGQGLYVSVPSVVFKEVLRLKPDGAVDTNYVTGTQSGEISGHALREDDRVLLYGNFDQYAGHPTMSVALLNANGSVDPSFKLTVAPRSPATSLIVQPDGHAYLGLADGRVLRISTVDGSIDPSFKLDPSILAMSASPRVFGVQPSGKLVLGRGDRIVRANLDGSRDSNYVETAFQIADSTQVPFLVAPEGSTFVGAQTGRVNGGGYRTLIKLKPGGGLDAGFKFSEDGTNSDTRKVLYLVRQQDGKLLLSGSGFHTANLFRVMPDGSVDPSFNSVATVSGIGIDAQGRILVNGTYIRTTPTFSFRFGLFRLLNDGVPRIPVVSGQPSSLAADYGSSAQFVISAAGAAPLQIQWRHDGADIAGATNSILDLAHVSSSDAGEYQAVVTNPNGAITSDKAILTVNSAPRILSQPQPVSAFNGEVASLAAGVSGEPPLLQQWFQNGQPIAGATSPVLPFPSLELAQAGDYSFVASNTFGSVTTLTARVSVQLSLPSWLVITNQTDLTTRSNLDNPFRPDTAVRMVSRGKLGAWLGFQDGVERWDDGGRRLWSLRFTSTPAASKLGAIAVDRKGNLYVNGNFQSIALLGDLGMTNTSIDKPRVDFVAKFDPQGHGLWYRMVEGMGVWSMTTDMDGGAAIAGVATGVNDEIRIGTLKGRRYPASEGFAAKISPDGTPLWLRTFPQVDFQVSTCEADSIAADETGIYVSGLFSFSIAFGTNQLHQGSFASTSYWLGKLSTNGEPLWIRQPSGTARQFASLVASAGHVYLGGDFGASAQHWSPEGVQLGTVGVSYSPLGGTVTATRLDVNSKGELMVVGSAKGAVQVGTNLLYSPAQRTAIWFGQWDVSGNPIRARFLAAATNDASGNTSSSVALSTWSANEFGDVYLAGSFNGGVRLLGQSVDATARAFVGKSHVPAHGPEVISQIPVFGPGVQWTALTPMNFSVTYRGDEPITVQWRRNGTPIPGATNVAFVIPEPLPKDNGLYDVVVSNAYGSDISPTPLSFVVRPPITYSPEPLSQLVILGDEVPSAQMQAGDTAPSVLLGRTVHAVITNGVNRWPASGEFDFKATSSSRYSIPDGGVLGAHSGSSFIAGILPELTEIRLLGYYPGSADMVTLSLAAYGGAGMFSIHADVVSTDGCCASGTISLRGGPKSADFRIFVNGAALTDPDLNFQWFHDGIAIPNATSNVLSMATVIPSDAGLYSCRISYRGYTVDTSSARLRVVGGSLPLDPPVLVFHPPAPGATSMDFSWPAGFVLQRATTLAPADWTDFATTPPVTIPLAQPGEFFRLIQKP